MRIGRCYICHRQGNGNPRDMIFVAPNMWRHVNCHVGSPRWLRSEQAKTSEFAKLFQNKGDEKNARPEVGYNRKPKHQTGPDPQQVKRAIQKRNKPHAIHKIRHRHKIHRLRHRRKQHRR